MARIKHCEPEREKKRQKHIGKRLLTVSEAAEYLGMAKQTIRNWASQGKIPKVKAHRALRFDVRALDRWIEERSMPAVA